MPKYVVENTRTEVRTEHGTWNHAMQAATRAGDPDEVVVHEIDRDGSRTYNTAGEILNRDGHFTKGGL